MSEADPIPGSTPSFRGAVLHIWLEDVSYADRRSAIVGETVLVNVAHEHAPQVGRQTTLDFCIRPTASIEPTHDYSIRVWLDHDADGKPGPGDLWSDQSYPVLTRAAGAHSGNRPRRKARLAVGPTWTLKYRLKSVSKNNQHFAIAIGIDTYPQLRPLTSSVKDATSFCEWLAADDGGNLPIENVKLIPSPATFAADAFDAKPIKDDIDKALRDRSWAGRSGWRATLFLLCRPWFWS